MAKYHVKQLNYIASGINRAFVNVDMEHYKVFGKDGIWLDTENHTSGLVILEQGEGEPWKTHYIKEHEDIPFSEEDHHLSIILNEQQPHFHEIDPEKNIVVRLDKDYTNEYLRKLSAFNANANQTQTLVVEYMHNDGHIKNKLSGEQRDFYCPIYDVKDVTIKSCNKTDVNANIKKIDQYVDMYMPNMYQNPLDFCQVRDNAYLITRPTIENIDYLSCQFNDRNQTYNTYDTIHRNHSYLYKSYSDWGYVKLSNAICADQTIEISDFFKPQRTISNLAHNFISETRLNTDRSTYDYGEIYGNLAIGKNEFNKNYSMQMPSQDHLTRCREYVGIRNNSNQVFLKFYDHIDYPDALSDNLSSSNPNVVPYQKVEFYYPNSIQSMIYHKPNLFSVKIFNSGIEQLTSNSNSLKSDDIQRINVLKQDITNAVVEIAKNLAPSYTQLFEVQYEEQ